MNLNPLGFFTKDSKARPIFPKKKTNLPPDTSDKTALPKVVHGERTKQFAVKAKNFAVSQAEKLNENYDKIQDSIEEKKKLQEESEEYDTQLKGLLEEYHKELSRQQAKNKVGDAEKETKLLEVEGGLDEQERKRFERKVHDIEKNIMKTQKEEEKINDQVEKNRDIINMLMLETVAGREQLGFK